MRLFIDKGMLIQERELTDGDGYPVMDKSGVPYTGLLEIQVYDEGGAPSTRSFHGEGHLDPPKIILGDPYRDTTLIEGTVARQATSESWDHFRGYRLAIESQRPLTAKQFQQTSYGESSAFHEGYREGQRERKSRGIKRASH